MAELGAYGLVVSLAGYLLVLRNSVAASAVRAMAAATEPRERARVFSAAAALYAVVGLATGLLIAGAAIAIAALILEGQLARDARIGGIGLGLLTALGIAVSVYLDALRAERLFVRAASNEIIAVLTYLALMLTLILSGASLGAVIACSGLLPLLSGLFSAVVVRRRALPYWLERGAVTRAAGHDDRAHRRLPAGDRALQPPHVRLPAGDPGGVRLGPHGGPVRGAAASAQPHLLARWGAVGAGGAHGLALRRHG